jgi:hypothetical protein
VVGTHKRAPPFLEQIKEKSVRLRFISKNGRSVGLYLSMEKMEPYVHMAG